MGRPSLFKKNKNISISFPTILFSQFFLIFLFLLSFPFSLTLFSHLFLLTLFSSFHFNKFLSSLFLLFPQKIYFFLFSFLLTLLLLLFCFLNNSPLSPALQSLIPLQCINTVSICPSSCYLNYQALTILFNCKKKEQRLIMNNNETKTKD